VPPIYDKSLLYIVSSLCESEPTGPPLVGMQRSGMPPPYTVDSLPTITQYVGGENRMAPTSVSAPTGSSPRQSVTADPKEALTKGVLSSRS